MYLNSTISTYKISSWNTFEQLIMTDFEHSRCSVRKTDLVDLDD